jgi:long-chain acyl-CoA synthetase
MNQVATLQSVSRRYPECNLGAFVQVANQDRQSNVCLIDLSGPSELVLTYAELETSVRRAAGALAAAGCRRGTRLAIALPNSSTYFVVFLAVMRLGGIPVLLNFKLNPDTIRFILQDSGAHGIFTDADTLPGVVSAANDFPLQFRLTLGGAPAEWIGWSQLFERAIPIDLVEPMQFNDQAFQPYTSGSTGVPKGVVLTHGGMLWGIEHSERYWPRDPVERAIVAAPMFHKNAMRGTIKPIVRSGASVVIMKEFRPRPFIEAVAKYKVTTCGGVPAMFAQLLKEEEAIAANDFSQLKLISMGSSSVASELIARLKTTFPHAEIKEGYGITEGGAPLRVALDGRKSPRGSVGMLAPEYEARLVDAAGNISADAGELWIRSPYVLKEYANRPDLTKERLVDGWLRTGDLFRIDEEGFYYFLGRNDDMFVCGGENVYPKEVESLILKDGKIADAIVVPLPHAEKGHAPAALVVAHTGFSVTPKSVQDFCAAHGPTFTIPRAVLVVDKLPLTGAEKPDREAAKQMLLKAFGPLSSGATS